MSAAPSKQVTGVTHPMPSPSDDERFGKAYTLHNATLRVYEGGAMLDKETNKMRKFDAGVKIKFPFMEKAQKISPRVLTELFWLLGNDEELKSFIRARITEEKSREHEF